MGLATGIGIGLCFGGIGAGGGYKIVNAELTTYVTGLTTPLSAAQLALLDTFISSIKTGLSISNLSDHFDIAYLIGGETQESSYRNIVKNAHHLTTPSAPMWTQYKGAAGDGISQYLDTNYNPSTPGMRYTIDNATLMILSLTDTAGTYADIGSRTNSTNYTAIYSRITGDTCAMRLHTPVTVAIDGAVTNSRAYFTVTRNAAAMTGLFGYRNKTGLDRTIVTQDTTTIPNGNLYIGARNLIGTGPEGLSPRQYAFACAGKYVSEAQRDVIIDAVEAYMDAHGEGVI